MTQNSTVKAIIIAFAIIAVVVVSPWMVTYITNTHLASKEAEVSSVADLSWIEPGLLRYYIEHDQFPV